MFFWIICMMGGLVCWSLGKKKWLGFLLCYWLWSLEEQKSVSSDHGVRWRRDNGVSRFVITEEILVLHWVVLRFSSAGRYTGEVCFLHFKPALVGSRGAFQSVSLHDRIVHNALLHVWCRRSIWAQNGCVWSDRNWLVRQLWIVFDRFHDDMSKDGRRGPTSSLMFVSHPGYDAVHKCIDSGHLKSKVGSGALELTTRYHQGAVGMFWPLWGVVMSSILMFCYIVPFSAPADSFFLCGLTEICSVRCVVSADAPEPDPHWLRQSLKIMESSGFFGILFSGIWNWCSLVLVALWMLYWRVSSKWWRRRTWR